MNEQLNLSSRQPLKKSVLDVAVRSVGTAWKVPAVKSLALTWLIRAGMGASGVAMILAVADAMQVTR